ncbi:MAG: porphobilinogen synthase [Candidatus Omnitrophica bacterium]|nr:porphobilinogen synthase [Candidatus Omnitrophota bacterium]
MEKKSKLKNLKLADLIYPYFVVAGAHKKEEVKSFPGIYRFSIDRLLADAQKIRNLGLNKILLFGVGERKDFFASSAYKENNLVALAIRALKQDFPDLTVITDVCLCAYTTHGHCGVLKPYGVSAIDTCETLKVLTKIALSHAHAGADWVAPSAMARGQVLAIRRALDKYGFKATKIMGYSAKFASNFYGPFRNAANSAPAFGDRSGYQLDYHDGRLALAEIAADIKEGADMVMVKPALSYLDIISQASLKFEKPLAAYNVSGEYALVKYGVRRGLWKEQQIVDEIIASIKRAGADWIITYHARDIAQWLKEK